MLFWIRLWCVCVELVSGVALRVDFSFAVWVWLSCLVCGVWLSCLVCGDVDSVSGGLSGSGEFVSWVWVCVWMLCLVCVSRSQYEDRL